MRFQVGVRETGFDGRISGGSFKSSPEQSDIVMPDWQTQTSSQAKNQYHRTARQYARDGKAEPAKPLRCYERQPDERQIQITIMDIIMPSDIANCQSRGEGDREPSRSKPDVATAPANKP